jgi:hypothetical protein
MIGAANPIVMQPALRALLVTEAACLATVSGKPMLFIPVAMPDGVISVSGGEQRPHNGASNR